MDDFQGLLTRDFGLRPQGKAAPMSASRATAAPTGSAWPNHRSTSASATSAPSYDDIFGPATSAPPTKPSPSPPLDSIFDSFKDTSSAAVKPKPSHSSMPVFDKPVYDDDDIFDGVPGMKGSSARHNDVFASSHAVPAYEDLLGGFGRKPEAREEPDERRKREAAGFDDLIPGFGGSSQAQRR